MTHSTHRELSKHSESTKSNQRAREQSDFVIPSEPKILRLVEKEIPISTGANTKMQLKTS